MYVSVGICSMLASCTTILKGLLMLHTYYCKEYLKQTHLIESGGDLESYVYSDGVEGMDRSEGSGEEWFWWNGSAGL